MKKNRPSQSGYTNFRIFLALTFCLAGLSLAAAAFARPARSAEEERERETDRDQVARTNAKQSSTAKKTTKERKTGGASKSSTVRRSKAAKSGSAPGATAPTQSGGGQSSTVTEHRNELGQTVYSVASSGFDISLPLRELATSAPETPSRMLPELELPPWRTIRSDRPDPVTQVAPGPRGLSNIPNPAAPSTGFNFAGIPGSGSFPPDTNGSVGNEQYVETVNTRYQVWGLNRGTNTVTSLLGPSSINTLWTGFTGANGQCTIQNAGDPIVVYDKVANRWLISQFTSSPDPVNSSYYQCVAVSTTADATGTYARYAFTVPNTHFGDYPHFGVWTDAYYMMAHGFTSASGGSYTGALFAAMDRTKMLAGDPSATWQVILDPLEGGHMPADLDGFAPPPTGAPGIFTSLHASGMYLYRMKVDFATPANTTRTLQAVMPVAPSNAACNGGGCIPQPGTTAVLDSLADRLMFRLAYRNFVDHESLVISHSVDPAITGVVSGVRWYDFRISGIPDAVCPSYPCTYQQGTIADVVGGRSRWMPSISMDGAENILVGYSTTGKTNLTENHSIRYTARAKTDPLGTMTAPEATIITGNRNMNSARWGDYTSTSIDPADDCTFWHANEHYTATGSAGSWKTQIASAAFPAGTGAGQCQPLACTSRPASAPTIGTVSVTGTNQLQVSWTGIAPTPGSYAIERAIGAIGSEGLYQPVGFVPGGSTTFTDTSVQGGVTYTYRVIAATDAGGRCQSLLRSGPASGVATGTCNLKPAFAGATSANSSNTATCAVTINWSPGTSSCPNTATLSYNIYRGTVPDFVPAPGNRIATCVPGPSSFTDSDNLTSGNTYYYVVRAEDNSTGNGGPCGGGNEESNSVVVAGTAYGSGTQASPGTWTDGGGDANSFLQLNPNEPGNSADQTWRFVKTADDAGANHTPGGSYAYRTAGPGPGALYADNACSVAETPPLTVGGTSVNLTYWERHQLEKGWDGVAIEYSLNGGAWTDVPAPSSSTGNGCLVSDITADYAALDCTGAPPANACGYPASKAVITGPFASGTDCNSWTQGPLTAYGRRCHLLTGLTAGDSIRFRWRFTSDPALGFAGFYLDDIAVTNVLLPNTCTPSAAASPTATPTATATATPTATATATATPTSTPTATATATVTPASSPTATATATVTPASSPTATATATATPLATATATATATPPTQAVNMSTRMRVDTGDNAGIGGFIITGSAPKHVAVRAMGPSLTSSGFTASEVLADPKLELHGPGSFGTILNNNWKDSQEAQIRADGLAPTNDLEAVIDATLDPGAYTAVVRGNGTGVGVALVEIYDLNPAAASKLANLSTRALVKTGDNVVIAGFMLSNHGGTDRIVVRGIGPSLSAFGIPNPLQDPTLELRDENGALLASNNDWQENALQAAEITAAGLAPSNTKESAIAANLPPGLYSAILAGLNNGIGVGLVEIYDRGP